MELTQYLHDDMLTFLNDQQAIQRSREGGNKPIRATDEEFGLFVQRDYSEELSDALRVNNIDLAKRIFLDAEQAFKQAPEGSNEREALRRILAELAIKVHLFLSDESYQKNITDLIQDLEQKGVFTTTFFEKTKQILHKGKQRAVEEHTDDIAALRAIIDGTAEQAHFDTLSKKRLEEPDVPEAPTSEGGVSKTTQTAAATNATPEPTPPPAPEEVESTTDDELPPPPLGEGTADAEEEPPLPIPGVEESRPTEPQPEPISTQAEDTPPEAPSSTPPSEQVEAAVEESTSLVESTTPTPVAEPVAEPVEAATVDQEERSSPVADRPLIEDKVEVQPIKEEAHEERAIDPGLLQRLNTLEGETKSKIEEKDLPAAMQSYKVMKQTMSQLPLKDEQTHTWFRRMQQLHDDILYRKRSLETMLQVRRHAVETLKDEIEHRIGTHLDRIRLHLMHHKMDTAVKEYRRVKELFLKYPEENHEKKRLFNRILTTHHQIENASKGGSAKGTPLYNAEHTHTDHFEQSEMNQLGNELADTIEVSDGTST